MPNDPDLTVVDGALWWPESASQDHDDIDLALVDPTGLVRAFSVSSPGIFERVRVKGAIQAGTWKVRIGGYQVLTRGQTVYRTAAAMRR